MTGRDMISASLRLIGAIAPGESPASQEATDGLSALNRMLDSWSIEGLTVYSVTAETPLTLTPADATVTLGASGDITTRPVEIEKALIRVGTLDYPPLQMLSIDEYTAIPLKSVQGLPYSVYDDGGYPQRTLTLYPVPSTASQLVLFTRRALTALDLDTTIALPPGYERALVYNGALELAPEYGKMVPDAVAMVAQESKANIKRANESPRYLRVDDVPAGTPYGRRFDMRTGGYR